MRPGLGMRLSDILRGGAAATPPVVKSTLIDDLVSYWTLDEVSGTRADAVGDNDLTDNNTVGVSLAGPSGTVANLDNADGQYLRTDAADETLDGTGDITVALWQKYASGSTNAFFSATTAGGNTKGFNVAVGATTYATFNDSTSGNSEPEILSTPVGWNFIVAKYSATTKKGSISRNGSAFTDGAALTNGLKDAQYICVGGNETATTAAQYGNVGVWSRILTAEEVTALFNAGVGKRYADLTAGEKTGLVSYWNYDEAQGNARADAHGSNDMSENGNASDAVGSVVNAGGAMHNAAASFVAANSEYLSNADLLDSLTESITFSGWASIGLTGNVWISAQDDDGANRGFSLFTAANGNATLYIFDSGAGAAVTSVIVGALTADTWAHILWSYDHTTKKCILYVDGVAGTLSDALDNGLKYNANTPFTLNSIAYPETLKWDEVGLWSRVLTADERTELYNAGAGKYYNATSEDFEE